MQAENEELSLGDGSGVAVEVVIASGIADAGSRGPTPGRPGIQTGAIKRKSSCY